MMKSLLLTLCSLMGLSAWASTQYLCEFGSQVAITNNDPQNPRITIINDSSRYTFMVTHDKPAGSYINLRYGESLPISVVMKPSLITFVERDGTDNGFAVSIFVAQGTSNSRPAVFSQHSHTVNAKHGEFYVPRISIGSCRVVTMR
jgi:hypothetical protein